LETIGAKKEIELKLYIGPELRDLPDRIAELGWQLGGHEDQEDIYYTSKYKDFIETEECLRIRNSGTAAQLTWKPPTSDGMRVRGQYWKQEIDVDITGQIENVRKMLSNLEFSEYVVVKKHRQVFRVDEDSLVALDLIDHLGWFVEIETFLDSSEVGTCRNDEIARLLGIDGERQVNVPYRDLVKAGHVYSSNL
jgi:adenylate cyclase, class 2